MRQLASRSTRTLVVAVAALALPLAAACAPTKSPAPPSGDIYQRINEHRAQNGVAPLGVCAPLIAAAQAHANDMAANGLTGHTGSDGSGPPTRIQRHGYNWMSWGEVVARDQPTADAVLAAWMGSPAHRGILLNGRHQHIGIGNNGGVWVADLGSGGAC